jgi:hypothetical protein
LESPPATALNHYCLSLETNELYYDHDVVDRSAEKTRADVSTCAFGDGFTTDGDRQLLAAQGAGNPQAPNKPSSITRKEWDPKFSAATGDRKLMAVQGFKAPQLEPAKPKSPDSKRFTATTTTGTGATGVTGTGGCAKIHVQQCLCIAVQWMYGCRDQGSVHQSRTLSPVFANKHKTHDDL